MTTIKNVALNTEGRLDIELISGDLLQVQTNYDLTTPPEVIAGRALAEVALHEETEKTEHAAYGPRELRRQSELLCGVFSTYVSERECGRCPGSKLRRDGRSCEQVTR